MSYDLPVLFMIKLSIEPHLNMAVSKPVGIVKRTDECPNSHWTSNRLKYVYYLPISFYNESYKLSSNRLKYVYDLPVLFLFIMKATNLVPID